MNDTSRLQRPLQTMPEDVREALQRHHVMDEYERRPAYQRNDYLAWIGRAKNPETREKRLTQMLDELQRGGVYMNMNHQPSEKS